MGSELISEFDFDARSLADSQEATGVVSYQRKPKETILALKRDEGHFWLLVVDRIDATSLVAFTENRDTLVARQRLNFAQLQVGYQISRLSDRYDLPREFRHNQCPLGSRDAHAMVAATADCKRSKARYKNNQVRRGIPAGNNSCV